MQNPLAESRCAWCKPPAKFTACWTSPDQIISAAFIDPPAIRAAAACSPSNTGLSSVPSPTSCRSVPSPALQERTASMNSELWTSASCSSVASGGVTCWMFSAANTSSCSARAWVSSRRAGAMGWASLNL